MSTKGSFIIVKDGSYKEVYIEMDAYPSGAGRDIVDLIKTCNINDLYDCLIEYDDFDCDMMDALGDDEPAVFSYAVCKEAALEKKQLITRQSEHYFINNSLFCEYGYVIDLDNKELQFHVGGQRFPQEGNRFGNMPTSPYGSDTLYYPSHLKAIFSLEHVKKAETESIIEKMQGAENSSHILNYDLCDEHDLTPNTTISEKKDNLCCVLREMADRLEKCSVNLQNSDPVSLNRIYDFQNDCIKANEAIGAMEKKIGLLKNTSD